MVNDRCKYFMNALKQTLTMKRTKITLYIAIVLWLAVATQAMVNRLFQEDVVITEAFVKTETQEMQSSIEVVAEYKTGIIEVEDKKKLILDLANAIGLLVDDDISLWEDDVRSEYYFFKQAKQAASEIKIVSIKEDTSSAKMKHYIMVRLDIMKGIQSIDQYKNILDKALVDLGVENKQITLKYEGTRMGDLTSKEKQEVANLLIDDLQGEIALEYDEGDLYTVYAYTGMLKEYITSMGNRINIQIAISYNELTNKTKISLATPVISENW